MRNEVIPFDRYVGPNGFVRSNFGSSILAQALWLGLFYIIRNNALIMLPFLRIIVPAIIRHNTLPRKTVYLPHGA